MDLSGRINEEYKAAFKAKDTAKVSTLRMLKAALKNKQIDLQHELTDEEIQTVIKTQIKQLKDSIQTFRQAGREEMASSAEAEVTVLEDYLPAQLSDEELTQIVREAVEVSGATSKADMGKAMGVAVKAVEGRADSSRVKAIVDSLLAIVILSVLGVGLAWPVSAQSLNIFPASETALLGIRLFRVLLVFFGLILLQQILSAVFDFMTSGVRDTIRNNSIKKISQGFMGTIVIVGLVSVITVFLESVS